MVKNKVTQNYLQFTKLSQTVFWDFYSLNNVNSIKSNFPIVELKEVIIQRKGTVTIDDKISYKRCRVQVQSKGVILRDEVLGVEIKTKKQQLCKAKDFLVAEIDAKVGGYGIVPQDLQGAIVSSHYFLFEIDESKLLSDFLELVVKQQSFFKQVKSTGSTNYAAIRPAHVLNYKIPLPTLAQQKQLVMLYNTKWELAEKQDKEASCISNEIEDYLFNTLGIVLNGRSISDTLLQTTPYQQLVEWGIDKIRNTDTYKSSLYRTTTLEQQPELVGHLTRGKSPKYAKASTKFILNQKCNRWDKIEVYYAKPIDQQWYESLDKNILTKENDIIVNSTGEGTIGRASRINSETSGYLYDSHILLLRLKGEYINPAFYTILFNSRYGQEQVNQIKSAQTTNQTELGVNNLKKIQFPFPPLDVQTKIVRTINTMMHRAADLEENALNNREQAKKIFNDQIFIN